MWVRMGDMESAVDCYSIWPEMLSGPDVVQILNLWVERRFAPCLQNK